MPTGKENRRAPRKRHDSVLELLDSAGRRIESIGRLVNVSTVGLCFSSTHAHPVGSTLHGRIRLLKEGVLVFRGHVVWSRRKANTHLYGIAFDSFKKAR